MLILLEGPDGSGKSTMATKLSDENNECPILKMSGVTSSKEVANERSKWFMSISKGCNIILDRSFIVSEYIYGNLFRNFSFVTIDDVAKYISLLMNDGAKIIYCRTLYNHVEDINNDPALERLGTNSQGLARIAYDRLFFKELKNRVAIDKYHNFEVI